MSDQPARSVLTHSQPLTVTIFGESDGLDQALSDELGRRGCRTHNVTVETGWLSSTSYAILRLDTPAGVGALRDLSTGRQPAAHIVAVCEEPADGFASDRLEDLCRQCGTHHEISLITHPRLAVVGPHEARAPRSPADLPTGALAVIVVDEIADQMSGNTDQMSGNTEPSFRTRSYRPRSA